MRMKRVTVLICFCLTLTGLAAQIRFESFNYAEALAKAKAENKLVFVDCYASWCAPCKQMAEHVFTQKKVGDYFNARFVNLKCDIEKEGKELSAQFGVQVVPTFLIITPDGRLLHRMAGAFDADVFIEKISRGADATTSLQYLEELYGSGRMNVTELRDYVVALLDAGRGELAGKLCGELLPELPEAEKVKAACWPIFSNTRLSPIFSGNFNYLFRNKTKFQEHNGHEKVDVHLVRLCSDYLMDKTWEQTQNPDRNYSRQELDMLDSIIGGLPTDNRKRLSVQKNVYIAVCEKDIPAMIREFTALASLLPQDKLYNYACYSGVIADIGTKADAKKLVGVIEGYERHAADAQLKMYIKIFNKSIRKRAADGVYFDDMPPVLAKEYAKAFKRPFFVCFYLPGNKEYRYLNEQIFADNAIGDLLKQTDALKINAGTEEGKKFMDDLGITKAPACVFVGGDGKVCRQIDTKASPEQFLTEIKKMLK